MRSPIAILTLLLVALISCGGNPQLEPEPEPPEKLDPLVVYAVNYPLAYFAERIGGDRVDVVFPAPDGVDPAIWSPTADAIAAYQGADLILLNGAGYAKWLKRVTLPESRLVDTGAAFADRLIELNRATTHSHGPEGEHEHRGVASTTWLDPELATLQARAVADAFVDSRPVFAAEFNQRFTDIEEELEALDQRLAVAAEGIGDEPLLFSHPVYQYLIRGYGLDGHEVHWEPEEAPDQHAWNHLDELLRSHPAKLMLWEREPLSETASRLEERGVKSRVFDTCDNVSDQGNYMTRMAVNAAMMESLTP